MPIMADSISQQCQTEKFTLDYASNFKTQKLVEHLLYVKRSGALAVFCHGKLRPLELHTTVISCLQRRAASTHCDQSNATNCTV
jgi:hypothetical protein